MNAPIIVSAEFGAADFAKLDGLRRAHFPPARNVLPAHLTLFHHLPPSLETEIDARLRHETRGVPAPAALITGVMNLGRGTALRIESSGLSAIRDRLADAFSAMLTPQDRVGWRPHVTIQNKVDPAEARALQAELKASFRTVPLVIAGLAAWHYRGGPWDLIARHAFKRH